MNDEGDAVALNMYNKTNKRPGKIKSIIGVAAGKGGVGKSMTTINLVLALCKAREESGGVRCGHLWPFDAMYAL